MIRLYTILFWIIILFITYTVYKYNQSRNKKLFFQDSIYLTYIWVLLMLVGFGPMIAWLLPAEPINLNFAQFHSETVVNHLNETSLITRYFFKILSVFSEINLIGLLCAALITMIWFYYVRSLDFFHKESGKYTIIVLLAGILATFLAFPLSDFVHYIFNIQFSENTFYNLFIFSFLGIGVVEELIKLLPVLFILFFTDEVDEPIDLIYYASISALGFAFIENLIYFRTISGSIIIGRGLTSTVGHMINSSFVVYGILLYKFSGEKRSRILIINYFLLGSLAHALFNYLLFEDLPIFFIIAFAFFIQIWAIIINNAVNNSKYFDYKILYRHHEVKLRLALFLAGLLIFSFVLNGLIIGKAEAITAYLTSLTWGGLLIIFYVSNLSSLDLYKGYWRPVKLHFSSPNGNAMPGMRGFSSLASAFTDNIIIPLNHVGKKIKLHSPAYNKHLCEVFDLSEGIIEERIKLVDEYGQTDIDWFLVKLTTPLTINEQYESHSILIKPRSKYSCLIHDEHIPCWLKLIPKRIDPRLNSLNTNYVGYGSIMINGEDYEYKN